MTRGRNVGIMVNELLDILMKNDRLKAAATGKAPASPAVTDAQKRQGVWFPVRGDVNPTFDTALSPQDEARFQTWRTQQTEQGNIHPMDLGQDYDLRGAFKAGINPDPATKHWPDRFKKPNHATFSDESVYSSLVGTHPGTWTGPNNDQYRPMSAPASAMQEAQQRQGIWTPPAKSQLMDTVAGGLERLKAFLPQRQGQPDQAPSSAGPLPKPGHNLDENRQLDQLQQSEGK